MDVRCSWRYGDRRCMLPRGEHRHCYSSSEGPSFGNPVEWRSPVEAFGPTITVERRQVGSEPLGYGSVAPGEYELADVIEHPSGRVTWVLGPRKEMSSR